MALDWVIRAQRYEYDLSQEHPLHAESYYHPQLRPLELDIHDGMELGIILEGAEERHYEGYLLPCQPGDVWLTATWEPHGWRVMTPHTRNLICLFLPNFLGDELLGDIPWLNLFAAPPSQRPRVRDPEMRARVLALAWEMVHEIEEQAPGWVSAIRLDMLRVLLWLGRQWHPLPSTPEPAHTQPHNLARIMPALTLVHAQVDRRVSAEEAAHACRLSRAQFNRIFLHTMHMSFARFCLRARLAFVAHSLLSTDRPVQDIAQQAGFVDASHLHRAFQHHYGCTPGNYRKLGL